MVLAILKEKWRIFAHIIKWSFLAIEIRFKQWSQFSWKTAAASPILLVLIAFNVEVNWLATVSSWRRGSGLLWWRVVYVLLRSGHLLVQLKGSERGWGRYLIVDNSHVDRWTWGGCGIRTHCFYYLPITIVSFNRLIVNLFIRVVKAHLHFINGAYLTFIVCCRLLCELVIFIFSLPVTGKAWTPQIPESKR